MDTIARAVHVLKSGGIAIFPTDTAFGIGCRIDDEAAVKRLFRIRKRAENKAVPVLISSVSMAETFLKPIPADVIDQLIKPYWPGGLTIVLPCDAEKVSSLVRGGTDTMGVRVPDHLLTVEIINGVGVPIIGTSANFSGKATPYSVEDLDPELTKLVDVVVPGECHGKQASTVIDCTKKPWKILRQGAVELKVSL
jgi:L-threonylcarbamoyladenylate synthase